MAVQETTEGGAEEDLRLDLLEAMKKYNLARLEELKKQIADFWRVEKRIQELYGECPECKGSGVLVKRSFFGLVERKVECPRCGGIGTDWAGFERDKKLGLLDKLYAEGD